MAKTPAWQRKEGKNPKGGLNAKGRASAKKQGMNLKPPAPNPKTKKDASRRKSFCARMSGMPGPMKDEEKGVLPVRRSHYASGIANMEMMVWNVILTGIVGVMAFMIKGKFDELDRLGILLNRTREEIARDHITRAEMNNVVERLGDRFDKAFERLELKVEEIGKR